jgi:hypothetical protein
VHARRKFDELASSGASAVAVEAIRRIPAIYHVEGQFAAVDAPQRLAARQHAHFSDRGRLFQADRGRRFSAIVDARGMRASEVFNVSQSSTISLKRSVYVPLSMCPQGGFLG